MFARGENSLFENAEHLDLLRQLQQAMPTVRQLDDVFQWLASTLVYRFDVALTQFWASSRLVTESDAHQLLALATQDPSVPERVVVNEEIRQVLERCVANQPDPFFFPLEQAVSSYQATRLNRYGFYYGGFAFLESALLPTQPKTASFPQRGPAPVAITGLLFFRQRSEERRVGKECR